MYSSIRELYFCDIRDFSRVPPEFNQNFEKSKHLIGLSKIAQTFAARF